MPRANSEMGTLAVVFVVFERMGILAAAVRVHFSSTQVGYKNARQKVSLVLACASMSAPFTKAHGHRD